MVKIKVILGSTRPTRFGIQPATWLMKLAQQRTDAEFELIDLAEINLPLLDEPLPALYGRYEKAHTKEWSQQIGEADGYVWLTAEYNHGVPAPLKNAIDFLAAEWNHKPVAIASYGAIAGGARAAEHLRATAAQLKMYDLGEQVVIPNYFEHLDEAGQWRPNTAQEKMAQEMLDALVFWAGQMQRSRRELAKPKA